MNKRLKQLRIELDMNQEEFGKILMLKKSGVSALESGQRRINEKHLKRLSLYTKKSINIDWLKTGEGEMFIEDEESRNFRIKRFVEDVMRLDDNDFKKRLFMQLPIMSNLELKALAAVVQVVKEESESKN